MLKIGAVQMLAGKSPGYFSKKVVLRAMIVFLLILFLSPYVNIPWLMSFLLKKGKIDPALLTYVFTTILTVAYTIFLQLLPTISSGEEDGHKCTSPVMIFIVLLLPISLSAQSIFNGKTKTKHT
jgi:hypothetical protein